MGAGQVVFFFRTPREVGDSGVESTGDLGGFALSGYIRPLLGEQELTRTPWLGTMWRNCLDFSQGLYSDKPQP